MTNVSGTKTRIRNLKWNKALFGIGVGLMLQSAQGIPELRIAVQGSDVVLT